MPAVEPPAPAHAKAPKALPNPGAKPKSKAGASRLLSLSWYQISFGLILLIAAGVCQSVYPLIPQHKWEDASEVIYSALLRFQSPQKDSPSRVAVLAIDQKTIDAYGWPIDRSYYVQALLKLRETGHPWVLSLAVFQALGKNEREASSPYSSASKDHALARAIESYERFIGSGLKIEAGQELSAEAEEELLPRILLTKTGEPLEDMPYLPFQMIEHESFVKAQRAFGYGGRFGTSATIHCMQMYVTDAAHSGAFVVPSSLVWSAAYSQEARIATQSGASWPRATDRLPFSLKSKLKIGYQHCLTSPSVLTADYLSVRTIETYSLADFLDGRVTPDFKDQLVVLAPPDMRRYRGPGIAKASDDGIIPEHLLVARFLDGLLTGETITREDLSLYNASSWLPLALTLALASFSLFLSPAGTIVLALAILTALLGFSGYQLMQNIYIIPIQAISCMTLIAAGLSFLFAYLRYHGIRRQIRFSSSLREGLAHCNTLAELEARARQACLDEFGSVHMELGDYDRTLYAAANDPNAALALIDHQRSQEHLQPPEGWQFAPRTGTVLTRVKKPRGITRMPLRAHGLDVHIAVEGKLGLLGTLRLGLAFKTHEESFINNLVDVLRVEVAQHWHRIKLLVDQKLLDYRFLMEQTRGDIMERFLTHVIVAKFSDNKTMLENLKAVLTPRPTRAALMQADIRGYSKVSARMAPLEMVRLLQRYYSNVVDAAQMVAQVKLIGDCIFLFIEDAAATADASPADLALELASILVNETDKQNALRAAENEEPLHFGIAIHYGEVVAGNLSSDSCIDYTVIGPNVNLVARLEELTKNPLIAERIGTNGVLMTEGAIDALVRHKNLETLPIELDALNVSVRSFAAVKQLSGVPAAVCSRIEYDRELFNPARKVN